jgi:Flp pilus assembly pilin Flp
LKDESGQDLIEYAFIAMIVALGVVISLTSVATAINAEFTKIAGKLT